MTRIDDSIKYKWIFISFFSRLFDFWKRIKIPLRDFWNHVIRISMKSKKRIFISFYILCRRKFGRIEIWVQKRFDDRFLSSNQISGNGGRVNRKNIYSSVVSDFRVLETILPSFASDAPAEASFSSDHPVSAGALWALSSAFSSICFPQFWHPPQL
jgi:hypothetical protein